MEGEEGGEGEIRIRRRVDVWRCMYRDTDISRAGFEIQRFNVAIRASLCDVHELLNTPPTCERWSAPTPTKNGNLSRCSARAVYVRVAAPHDWCLARLFDFARRWCTINQQENINSASRRVTALLGDGLMARARRRPFDISPTRKSRSLASFSRAADCQPMSWYLRKQIFWT